MDRIEATYDSILRTVFKVANPVKKSIIKTHCIVHKFINTHAVNILKNDKYLAQYNFFKAYLDDINEGAVWADQDFKSSNHFYDPYKKKGMFGRKSAMDLAIEYHDKALDLWSKRKYKDSMFYVGASLHIIQDMTVPQHANVRLLDNHRQYEMFIIRMHTQIEEYKVNSGAYLLDSIEDYVRFNARVALKIHRKFRKIKDDEIRFYRVSRCGIALAERTTAGAMVMFYNNLFNKLN